MWVNLGRSHGCGNKNPYYTMGNTHEAEVKTWQCEVTSASGWFTCPPFQNFKTIWLFITQYFKRIIEHPHSISIESQYYWERKAVEQIKILQYCTQSPHYYYTVIVQLYNNIAMACGRIYELYPSRSFCFHRLIPFCLGLENVCLLLGCLHP